MPEGSRHGAHHDETERLPEAYGRLVGLDHGVELDAAEVVLPGPLHQVLTEGAAHPRPEAAGATMKLPVAMCEPRPGRFGPMVAVPTTSPSSSATTIRP